MSRWVQSDALKSVRNLIDDQIDGKVVFQYSPLLGAQDGTNKVFQIPQSRVVAVNSTVYKNKVALVPITDFNFLNPKMGTIQFVAAPAVSDELSVTFAYVWFTDDELDTILNRAANECGFSAYYTDSSGIVGAETVDILPTDIETGLKNAISLIAASTAAAALADRFAQKYQIQAGDQSFNPEAVAQRYADMADKYQKRGLNARDDTYKGAGKQYRPGMASQGWMLPSWTPKR